MTWLEEKLEYASNYSGYYRLVIDDPECYLSKNGKIGLFNGIGIILKCIDNLCENEDEADEVYDNLNDIFNILERELTNPPANTIPKEAKFAYKEKTFKKYFELFDEVDNILKSFDLGFSIEIEEITPNKIVWEDKDQIAYV